MNAAAENNQCVRPSMDNNVYLMVVYKVWEQFLYDQKEKKEKRKLSAEAAHSFILPRQICYIRNIIDVKEKKRKKVRVRELREEKKIKKNIRSRKSRRFTNFRNWPFDFPFPSVSSHPIR